jgi:hypothetical protein
MEQAFNLFSSALPPESFLDDAENVDQKNDTESAEQRKRMTWRMNYYIM